MKAREHHRTCDAGRTLGELSAKMADRGRAWLVAEGLGSVSLPMVRDTMCASCACRSGTVPNGCLQTQLDLLKTVVEAKPFLCHSPKDGRMCAGYIAARVAFVQMGALPPGLLEAIAQWEYSPADEPEADNDH
jgi:hypothetical protein